MPPFPISRPRVGLWQALSLTLTLTFGLSGAQAVVVSTYDFEGGGGANGTGLDGWNIITTGIGDDLAFSPQGSNPPSGAQPVIPTNFDSGSVQGQWAIRTWDNQITGTKTDGSTGVIRSDPFTLPDMATVDFLIGGGNHPWGNMDPDNLSAGPASFNLEREVAPDDWETVFTATGANQNTLVPGQWDASAYGGATVRFAIYDLNSGGWGWVGVDNIVISTTVDIFDPTDSDGDTIGDNWENFYFGDLSRDGTLDYDGEGLTDLQEWNEQTNPKEADTDGDNLNDAQEVAIGTDPNDPDSDNDGWTDGEEVVAGTDPNDNSSAPTPPPVTPVPPGIPVETRDAVVVFNEIHYQPAGDDSTLEYIELHNQMAADVDLSNWRLDGDVDFDFPEGTTLAGGGYLVLASNPAALQAATSYSGALGPFSGQLANSGGRLRLYNNNRSFRTNPGGVGSPGEIRDDFEGRRLMDEIDYSDVHPWPVGADGSGSTLAKFNAATGSPHPANWRASSQSNGTPGSVNTFPVTPALAINEVAGSADSPFRIELFNLGGSEIQLGGMVLASSNPLHADYTFPASGLPAGNFLTITDTDLGYTPEDNNRLFLFTVGQAGLIDSVRVDDLPQARSPDGTGRWLRPDAATFGSANSFALRDEIVINELFYHAYPQRESPGTPPSIVETTVLDFDSSWRFEENAGPAGLPTGWDDVAHPAWPSGQGLLAEETSPLGETIRTDIDLAVGTVTYYFETEFTHAGGTVDEIFVQHYIDDGAVFYLNGVEIRRVNMPVGAVTPSTLASAPGIGNATLGSFLVSSPNVLPGSNRLSVEVHQISTGSSDVVFGAKVILRTLTPSGNPPVPYAERDEEWLELYNRSGAPVDLTGWKLRGGISYNFPDTTTIPSGGYLVVAKDAAALAAKHPAATILGDYSNRLGNRGDQIVLEDPVGNPADEVTYFDSGKWHGAADGGGSSLELRDPDADNSAAGAWAPSDETGGSSWQTITYEGIAIDDGIGNNVYHEFLLGLLDAGEILIDDVSVIEDPTGAAIELIQNGDFEGDPTGANPASWRCVGTHGSHGRTVVVTDPDNPGNKCLHVVATGPTEDKHNKIETTYAGGQTVNPGTTYRISFRAKWQSGLNLVNTRLYFNYLQRTHVLDVPEVWGTPGAANSTAVANAGPSLAGLVHSPVVPPANQAITVRIDASDPDGIGDLTLFYSVNGGAFQNVPMALAPGGEYSGTIPGQGASSIVRFYVRARDSSSQESFYPAAAAEGGAFLKVEDGLADSSGTRHNLRIIMSDTDRQFLFNTTNRLSNDRFPATVIEDEGTIYYDVGLRLKASGFGRFNSGHFGFNLRFQPDGLFRGVHRSISVERSPNLKEITAKHLMNRAGGGYWSFYDDVARIISPTPSSTNTNAGIGLLSMARHTESFFAGLFPDESESGTLFNLELLYNPNGTTGDPEGLKIGNPYNHTNGRYDLVDRGADKEPYRWGFQIRSARGRDDYSQLIALNQAMGNLSGTALKDALDPIIDVDQWMRTFAMASLNGTDDVYSRIWEHNWRFYVRPTDGKVMVLQWDLDRSFQLGTNSSVTPTRNTVMKLFTIPQYRRMFDGHLEDLIQSTFNSTYISPWATHFSALTGASNPTSYITSRASHITGQLPGAVTFAITTNGGADFSEADSVVELEGNAWIDVFEIRVNGVPADAEWTDADSWKVNVPIGIGPNALTISGFNNRGVEVASDTITVTNTSPVDVANASNTIISELHYHPADPTAAEIGAGFTDQDLFEFVELTNTGTNDIDLTGVKFTDGVTFTFPVGTSLGPGARLVVVADQAAFEFRYGAGTATVAGVYTGNFRNSGERVRLEAADATAIADFEYLDESPWPDSADGDGYSLVFAGGDPTDPLDWRSSATLGGDPGADDSVPFPGGDLVAYALASEPAVAIVGDTFVLDLRVNLASDGARVGASFSTDLSAWTPAPATNLLSRTNHGDGTATWSFRSPLPPSTAPRQFGKAELESR